MIGPVPPQSTERFGVGTGRLASGDDRGFHEQCEEWTWGQTMGNEDGAGDPPKCILRCAIALGELVQGCSLDFVSPLMLDELRQTKLLHPSLATRAAKLSNVFYKGRLEVRRAPVWRVLEA